MNDTLKVLETRRSCRNFDPAKPIEKPFSYALWRIEAYRNNGSPLELITAS